MQVGGILDDSAANHPRKSEPDGANLLALGHGVNLLLDAVADVFRGHGLQSVERGALFWIESKRPDEFVVFDETDRDVFHYDYADGFGHCCCLPQFVETVEGGGFIAFRQRRVVEDGVREILDGSLERKNSLPDVEQLRRAFSDDVYAQQLFGIGIENQLYAPGGGAANVPARDLPEKSDPHFVRHALFGELLFRFADEGNFRNGVNPIGIVRAVGMDGNAESVGRGDAALLHGDRAEAGKPDDVADREDVWLFGAVIVVDRDAPARVGFQAGGGQIQLVDVALAPDRVE